MNVQKNRILIVDDDKTISPLLKEYLEENGYECTLLHNAFDALSAFKSEGFDLCIFDVVMPMKNGHELAKEIQMYNTEIPFLFLTSLSGQADRIKGLEIGAEDYIIKPFSMKELLLRVNIILKRAKPTQFLNTSTNLYQIGIYQFNANTRKLTTTDSVICLSSIETKLLQMFCESSNGIILREQALNQIWGDQHNFKSRSLNVYISKLRNFFNDSQDIEILNIHGSGYQLVVK